MSGDKITRRQAMNSTKQSHAPENGDSARRKFLQGGLATAVTSAFGLSSFVGSTAAKTTENEGPTFELLHENISTSLVEKVATPLLKELSADGILPSASGSAFPSQGLTTSDEPGGVAVYRVVGTGRVERTAVGFFDGNKVTVNMPETGQAYAIVTPDDTAASKLRYELGVEGVEVTSFGSGGFSTQDCSSTCGGSTCSDSGNCWWEDRYCVEDCLDDGTCHDSCSCGCP